MYANLEWGRFEQAKTVLDGYFTDFVYDDGMINMRGPETAQFGLTLSLLARYFAYTGDKALLVKHQHKIVATVNILIELHDKSLALAQSDRGYGLIHGWNESDACLFEDPSIWWKPYYANSAMTVRGFKDISAIWPKISHQGKAQTKHWLARAEQLQNQLEQTLKANIRYDMQPPYIGPLPGVKLTFRQALAKNDPSEQGWPHRAYAELLHADVLPNKLANLVIDCMRAYGATSMGVVANITAPNPRERNLLGFISYGYAQQLLRLDRIDEYLLFMYAHRHHAHTPGSWTAGEVTDISGGMPLFCMPAQLTIPLLLRWTLVFDQDEHLYLGRALPHAWLLSGDEVSCKEMPTAWGKTAFSLRFDKEKGQLLGQVTLPSGSPKATLLTLRLPKGKRWSKVRIAGNVVAASGPNQDRFEVPAKPGATVSVQADLA